MKYESHTKCKFTKECTKQSRRPDIFEIIKMRARRKIFDTLKYFFSSANNLI